MPLACRICDSRCRRARPTYGGGWRDVATGSGQALRHRPVDGDRVGPRVAPDRQLSAESARGGDRPFAADRGRQAAAVLALAEETPDMTLAKIAAHLQSEHGMRVSQKHGVALLPPPRHHLRKTGSRQRACNDLTCCGAGAPGSKPGPVSTPERLVFVDMVRRTVAEGRVSRRAGLPPRWRGAAGRALRGHRCRAPVPRGHWKTDDLRRRT